jgi:hypothetical protein
MFSVNTKATRVSLFNEYICDFLTRTFPFPKYKKRELETEVADRKRQRAFGGHLTTLEYYKNGGSLKVTRVLMFHGT